jgi:UDP-2,3-diacylglucosamine hydrolase
VTTLFISDLHLSGAAPAITAQFLQFLRTDARAAEHLYILGDLFEFWIGDDDPDTDYREIQTALRALTDSGVPCSVMHGNRDFLLGRKFCERTGCRLVADGAVAHIYGERVLLTHGDVLCTDDHAYQRLRRFVRNPVVQWLFKCLPLARRERIASRVRRGSQMHTQQTASNIMDVNEQAVLQAFRRANTRLMIHGHTHRPDIHLHTVEDHAATRIVLGDWYTQGSVLRWSASGFELLTLPRTTQTPGSGNYSGNYSGAHPSENGTAHPVG